MSLIESSVLRFYDVSSGAFGKQKNCFSFRIYTHLVTLNRETVPLRDMHDEITGRVFKIVPRFYSDLMSYFTFFEETLPVYLNFVLFHLAFHTVFNVLGRL